MRDWLKNYFIYQNKLEQYIKKIFYIVIFVKLCFIDLVVGSATGYIQIGYKSYIPIICIFIILLSFRIYDYLKLKYLILVIAYFFSSLSIYNGLVEKVSNHISLKANILLVFLLIILGIRIFDCYYFEKRKPSMRRDVFFVFLIMTILMILIRPDFIWPYTFLSIMIFFYLTEYSENELNNLFCSMLDGIIIGFIIIQIQAWMYRPYDTVRYYGMYAHPNMNALFYLCAYCATLAKWYYMKLNKKNILIRIIPLMLSGLIIATMFFTGGRAAFIAFIVLTFVFFVFILISPKERTAKDCILSAILLFLSICALLLPSYWLLRYIPGYINEPLYLEQDIGREKWKVTKNESIYSEKYTELNEAADEMFERYLWFLDDELAEYIEEFIRDFPESLDISIKADAATIDEGTVNYIEPGSDKDHPLELTGKHGEGTYDVRIDIYKYFWNKVELIGNKNNPIGVWTSKNNFAGHCHNLFLQMAYDFGIIVGVVFILLILLIYIRIIIGLIKERTSDNYFRLFVATMYITLFVVFGMFEVDWRYGQLSFTMFFVVQYVIHHKASDKTVMEEISSMGTGQYIVPEKGRFKGLVVMDLDAEETGFNDNDIEA